MKKLTACPYYYVPVNYSVVEPIETGAHLPLPPIFLEKVSKIVSTIKLLEICPQPC